MGLFATNYTVLFESRFDDYLILSISYSASYADAIATQIVLNKDRREPNFITKEKEDFSGCELEDIINQTNKWCDSLNFPRPIWKQ